MADGGVVGFLICFGGVVGFGCWSCCKEEFVDEGIDECAWCNKVVVEDVFLAGCFIFNNKQLIRKINFLKYLYRRKWLRE